MTKIDPESKRRSERDLTSLFHKAKQGARNRYQVCLLKKIWARTTQKESTEYKSSQYVQAVTTGERKHVAQNDEQKPLLRVAVKQRENAQKRGPSADRGRKEFARGGQTSRKTHAKK